MPYRTPGWPPAPADYLATLERFEAAGDRAGIVRYFNNEVVGMPSEMVDGMVGTPMWEPLLSMAYTVKYDAQCLGGDDQSIPADTFARVTVPVPVGLQQRDPDAVASRCRGSRRRGAARRHLGRAAR